jgi:Protein of unknown function (DUF3288)
MQDTEGPTRDQVHPLYDRDCRVVRAFDRLEQPTDQVLVDAARLLIRYDGFPGARDIPEHIIARCRAWGIASRVELNARCRAIWASGFRPTFEGADVGSGADVAASVAASA